MADEIRSWEPSLPALNRLARALRVPRDYANRAQVPDWLPLLGGQGLGDLLMGQAPEELERWAYGDLPMRVPEMSAVPVVKTGRKAPLADVLGFAADAGPLARVAARGASRGALRASDAATRAITGNPAATAMRIIEETRMPVPAAVIKPKGGNWLSGSVETRVEPLKNPYVDKYAEAVSLYGPEKAGQYVANPGAGAQELNQWLDKKLAKYIRNEMATPEDPIRALAERGTLHVPGEQLEPSGYEHKPAMLGGYQERLSESELARRWEDAADSMVNIGEAGRIIAPNYANPSFGSRAELAAKYLRDNPWLAKVPPETEVYALAPNDAQLGFGHLVDELRNAINPESGLPADLLWKYSDLNKVSVPQAVERVAKINEWRAAQKALADAARARNPATQVFKEYPEQGFSWVELRKPEGAEDAKALEDALKYEGETMGHCVGGYCPDVEAGRSRIFSLRSAKGEPHVTIEVRPGRKITEADLPDEVRNMLADEYGDASREEFEAAVARAAADPKVRAQIQGDWMNDKIIQIKGKANRAPNEEYLPFVQDFVRSQKWGSVGDLQNTGLRFIDTESDLGVRLREAGVDVPPYVSEAELTDLLDRYGRTTLPPSPPAEGFASGGLVSADYDPARVASLADRLEAELFAV